MSSSSTSLLEMYLNQLVQFVAKERQRYLSALRLALHQCFRKMRRLFQCDFRGHGRLIRIDHNLDNARLIRPQRTLEGWADLIGFVHGKPDAAADLRILSKIRIVQLDAILRIAKKYNLLPFDLSQRSVLDDHYHDRQVVFDSREELAHQHRKSTVTDEGDRLSLGKCKLGGNRVRQSRRHSRQCP